MTAKQKVAVWAAALYAVFWLGGNYSFQYTHTCVRSHQEEQVVDNNGDTQMVTVCDWYSANGRRWTFLDPLRSAWSVQGWEGFAIFGAIGLWIGWSVWKDRRQHEQMKHAQLYS